MSLRENQWKKKTLRKSNIYRWLYYISKIKLYEPFMLNMVWISTKRFGILKWKCVGTQDLSLKHYLRTGLQKLACARGRLPIRWRLCVCPRRRRAPLPEPSSATPSFGREALAGSSPDLEDGRCSSAGGTHTQSVSLVSSSSGSVCLYCEAEAGLAARGRNTAREETRSVHKIWHLIITQTHTQDWHKICQSVAWFCIYVSVCIWVFVCTFFIIFSV